MRETAGQTRGVIPREVPTKALLLSLAALAIPVVSGILFPGLAGEQYGLLIWLLALVPAFLLTYYKGLKGAALAVAAAMAALSLSQVLLLVLDLAAPQWTLLLLIVANFLVITFGFAVVAELLHRERRRAEGLALVDQLTQLPNRRHMQMALDREFAAAMRGRKLAIVMYDVDHFKQFNDTHGHAVGDDVLRTVGGVLQQYTRKQNVSARYGGEEFISLVSDVDLDGVLIFANRVREAIKNKELPWGHVSVSGGVAMYRPGMGSHEVLVAAADRALYAAKEAGRDRVEVAEDVARISGRTSAPRVSAPGQPKHVLVVHDDPDERSSFVELLRGRGFKVEETGSPEEAARFLREGAEPFDVLVTSLVMPRISGFTLVDQLSSDGPDLRVVYLSESVRERVSWPGAPGAVRRFVPKPVDPDVLLTAVKEALEEEVK
jgi:diguanylate cyclase (GGDEF)-like protein